MLVCVDVYVNVQRCVCEMVRVEVNVWCEWSCYVNIVEGG